MPWIRCLKTHAVSIFLTFIVSGCNRTDQPQWTGLFIGSGSNSSVSVQMIARLPGAKKNELNFEVYPVIANSTPRSFEVLFEKSRNQKQKVTLITDFVISSGTGMKFAVDLSTSSDGTRCSDGPTTSLTHPEYSLSQLCVSPEKIDFEVSRSQNHEIVATLHLIHNSKVPVPTNKTGEERVYSLEEVVGRTQFLNYSVQQVAERVFQARENVKIAQGNLLPRIQIRNIFSLALMDVMGIVEGIGNFLPFLFPANWYQWEGAKHLSVAERKSFASLRGNEMQAVETLFHLVQRDEKLLELVHSHLDWLQQIEENLLAEEQVGLLPHGSAEYFGTKVIAMKQDREQIVRLLELERASLSQSMGLSPMTGITKTLISSNEDLSLIPMLNAQELSLAAKKVSLEAEVLDALAQASDSAKDAAVYGFLSPSSDATVGFSTFPRIEVGKSQRREIEKKKEEVLTLVEQRSLEIKAEHDAAIHFFIDSKESILRERNRLSWLMKRHFSGDATLNSEEFLNQLSELQNKILIAESNQISSVAAYRLAQSKRSRLLRTGFYENLEVLLPSEPGQVNCKDLSSCTTVYGF